MTSMPSSTPTGRPVRAGRMARLALGMHVGECRLPCRHRQLSGTRLRHRQGIAQPASRSTRIRAAAASETAASSSGSSPGPSLMDRLLRRPPARDSTAEVGTLLQTSINCLASLLDCTEYLLCACLQGDWCLLQATAAQQQQQSAIPNHWLHHLDGLPKGKQRDLRKCAAFPDCVLRMHACTKPPRIP